MKLVLRTLIFLAAAVLVAGLALVIANSLPSRGGGRFEGGPRPGFAEGQPAPGTIERVRPEGGREDGGFGNLTSNLFGLREALVNLAIIGWVTLVGVLLLRWARPARGGDAGPPA